MNIMDKKILLYPLVRSGIQKRKQTIADSKDICQANKDSLDAFTIKLEADGISPCQILSHLDRIKPIAKLLGKTEFKKAARKDMERAIAGMRQRGVVRKGKRVRDLSTASMNKTIECIKCFWRWLYGLTRTDNAPDAVKWLKKERTNNTLRKEDLWTEEEIGKVINAANSLQTKAAIAVLSESGIRPGEARGMKLKDLVVNSNTIRLYVAGKTEKKLGERVVPIVRSYNILRLWLENHPDKSNSEAWLWPNKRDPSKPISNPALSIQVRRAAKKAGINKPCNLYLLRHLALTRFYGQVPAVAYRLAGHKANSIHKETYFHLNEQDLEDAIKKMNGIEEKEETKEATSCPKCGHALGMGEQMCANCGAIPNSESAMKKLETDEFHMKLGRALIKRAEANPKILDELMKGVD